MNNNKLKQYVSTPAIVGDNYDEMFIIGTKHELLILANSILKFIDCPLNDIKLCSKEVYNFSERITDELCPIVLDGVVMTKSEEDKEMIVNEYLKNNNDMPIDWRMRKLEHHSTKNKRH